jgi:glutathione-regulated potassium-efflux system ancillary protein KefG
MAPMVNTEQLIDSRQLADLIGLSHPNSVSLYQRRYPDMPRPIVDLGRGRPRLWLKPDVVDWLSSRVTGGARHLP